MTRPTPRPYQSDVIARNYEAWKTTRNIVDVVPTGGGKSVIIGEHAWNDAQIPGQNVIMAHRQELVGQLSGHVARAGIRHRIIAPKEVIRQIAADHRVEFGRVFIDPDASTSVGGVDTIRSRKSELEAWAKQVKRWTIDEAHHVLTANKWGACVAMFPNAFGLGVTATPQRADGNGIGTPELGGAGVFGAMILGPTTRELIDMGALCEYEIAAPQSDIDVISLKVGDSGDYSPKQMREASKNSHIVGDVVEQYVKLANGKQGVVFATDVETATEIAEKFRNAGIGAAVVTGETDGTLRADLVRRFRRRELRILVNVDLFGEGFDVPGIEVVQMARPTASLAVYLQQFGRVLRPMLGKLYGMVIDHVGNVKRHGLPDKKRIWSLASRDKRRKVKETDPDDIPVKTCVNTDCVRSYLATLQCCPYCGTAPVPQGGGRSIEQVDGDLTLLTAEVLAALRKAAEPEATTSVWARVAQATGSDALGKYAAEKHGERLAARDTLAETIALWAGYERAKGRPDSESYRRFYFALGVDVATALGADRAKLDEINGQVRQWLS